MGVAVENPTALFTPGARHSFSRHASRDYQHGWKSYAKAFIQDYGLPRSVAGGAGRQAQGALWE